MNALNQALAYLRARGVTVTERAGGEAREPREWPCVSTWNPSPGYIFNRCYGHGFIADAPNWPDGRR